MKTFVTSDLHLNHPKILLYDNLPFQSVEEMDETIIYNWNFTVGEDDLVYVLGDFAFGNRGKVFSYFQRLNGMIHVLCNPWHHDKYFVTSLNDSKDYIFTKSNYVVVFEQPIVVRKSGVIRDDRDVPVVLCHYPMQVWDRKHYLSFHLYGHVHKPHFEIPGSPLSYNVAMVRNMFTPVDLDFITTMLEKRIKELNLVAINEEE